MKKMKKKSMLLLRTCNQDHLRNWLFQGNTFFCGFYPLSFHIDSITFTGFCSQLFEKLSLPCADMYQKVKHFAEYGSKDMTMYSQLLQVNRLS